MVRNDVAGVLGHTHPFKHHSAPSVTHVISASGGALCSALVCYDVVHPRNTHHVAQLRVPTDTLRHRVQAYLHPNVGAAAHTIAVNEGPRGLFRGFGPTIMRDVPEIALQFVIYDRYDRCGRPHGGITNVVNKACVAWRLAVAG